MSDTKAPDAKPAKAPETKKHRAAQEFWLGGKHIADGELVELTDSQAKRLGVLVKIA